VIEAVLSPQQRAVMERAILEEEQKRRHLVIALSGAHAYGFPSPDSDLDLKAVHVEPTARLLGLVPGAPAAERLEVLDAVEIDYSSNELKPVLWGVVQGNGNYIERLLGGLLPRAAPELATLQPLVQKALSRRLHRHYLGFAHSQLLAFEGDPAGGSAKKLLYVLRTALTGAHALLTGRVVTDLRDLIDEHGFPDARELIEAKRAGEAIRLSGEVATRWGEAVKRVFAVLEDARERSILPAEPQGVADLEAWLLEERRRGF